MLPIRFDSFPPTLGVVHQLRLRVAANNNNNDVVVAAQVRETIASFWTFFMREAPGAEECTMLNRSAILRSPTIVSIEMVTQARFSKFVWRAVAQLKRESSSSSSSSASPNLVDILNETILLHGKRTIDPRDYKTNEERIREATRRRCKYMVPMTRESIHTISLRQSPPS